ncbi:beta-lactamase/transpeptidase-like protein [Trametes elegans]|nr:beta-lactamase/transpeptidase-like protein [Trametes elegans]
MEKSNVPGLAVGVARPSTSGFSGALSTEFGLWGIMSEDGANVTTDTLFGIGSCSKAFTALITGVLMEDYLQDRNTTPLPEGLHEFDWDTRVSDLLPRIDWVLADEWATKDASVADVLSHVTGLPRHDFSWYFEESALDVVGRLRLLKTTHGLREKWDYSNQMYIVASYIISRYAGQPYTAYATERLIRASAMNATTFPKDVAERSGKFSHRWSATGRRLEETFAGPGGIISSARDMTRWISFLLRRVKNFQPGGQGINPKLFTDVTTACAIVFGRSLARDVSMSGYGLSWLRMTYHGHEVMYHMGGMPGFRSMVILLPHQGAGVVSFANSEDLLLAHDSSLSPTVNTASEAMGYPRFPADALRSTVAAPATSTPLERFAGSYNDPGYGNLTLCVPSTASARMAARVPGGAAGPAEPGLFWMTPHFFFPEGYGVDRSPFDYQIMPPGYGMYVQCVTTGDGEDGEGAVDGYVHGRKRWLHVREQAEVWFERVA